MPWIAVLIALAVGAVSWTLAEYLLHRFAMHVMAGRGHPSREHLTHHARRNYFTTLGQKFAAAGAVVLVTFPLVALATSVWIAVGFCAGLAGASFVYEWLHYRAHTHGPRNAYGAWLRRNHFAHHFHDPTANFGVTSPVWDIVFRTSRPVDRVAVPRRWTVGTMEWLTDDAGEVRSELAGTYVIVGSDPAAHDEDDEAAAFANVAPTA